MAVVAMMNTGYSNTKKRNKYQEIYDMWEDKDIRFDLPFQHMRLRAGEKMVDRLDSVEDTKGNGGDRGRLIITNLRILWHSLTSPRVSLSIGLNTIVTATTKHVISKLRGAVEALYLLTKTSSNRYEFVFTNLIPGTTRLFTSAIGVHRAYTSSRLYRELKLRGSVVREKQLQLLPLEHIVSTERGVWNLSSDQGNLGTFFITNVRLVWFAEMNEHFSLSLPYLQMSTVKIRDSKFGVALVVETCEASGGYILGFRIDPLDKMKAVLKEIASLMTVYGKNPVFGVEYTVGSEPLLTEEAPSESPLEDEVNWEEEGVSSALEMYAADSAQLPPQPPVYCAELGLAVERLAEGFTMQSLWQVLPAL